MSKTLSILAAAATLAAAASAAHAAAFTVSETYATSGTNTIITVLLTSTAGGGTDGTTRVTDVGNVTFSTTVNAFRSVPVFQNDGDGTVGDGTASPGPKAYSRDYFEYAAQEQAYADSGSATLLSPALEPGNTMFLAINGQSPASVGAPGVDSANFTAIGVGTNYGVSAKLLSETGGFTIADTSRLPVYALAQLVVPSTLNTPVSYSIADINGVISSGSFSTQPGAVPEPASLGVLALGAVGLLSRRKKTV